MSGGANIVKLEPIIAERGERRRAATLSNMRASLHALSLELERIRGLGNADAARALATWAERLDHQQGRAHTLAEEFRELADKALDEGSE